MNSLAESTLDAIELMYNNAVQKSKATKTVECKIVEKLDAGLGLYRVSYLGNDNIEAYASNNINYQVDDIVYVLIPEGDDFSQSKFIIGAVSPSGNLYTEDEDELKYFGISENLFGDNTGEIQLCTYHSDSKPITIDSSFNEMFSEYLTKYKDFIFSAKIKTEIPTEQQVKGNYGLILSLPILIDDGTGDESGTLKPSYMVISLDVNTMQGNPYQLSEYTLQNYYVKFSDDMIYDAERKPELSYFIQDFAQDLDPTIPADIFIKDISFTAQEEIPVESIGKYYLSLVASGGNYFLEGTTDSTKTITPILKINGKDTRVNSYDCYWFVEDASIGILSDDYVSLGGIGWKCLNEKTNIQYSEEGKQVFDYVKDNYTYTVNKEDVLSTLEYKCVLVNGSGIFIEKTIELKNLASNFELQLVSSTNTTSFVKGVGTINLISRISKNDAVGTDMISSAWQRFDKNKNYLGDDFYTYVRQNDIVTIDNKKWIESEISFPCSIVEDQNLIKCTFYRTVIKQTTGLPHKENLGTKDIVVSTSEPGAYKIIIENGDVIYKYDADGDAPNIADYDGPYSSKITEIKPINFRVYKEDGSELSDLEYKYCTATWDIPTNSMIKLIKNKKKDKETGQEVDEEVIDIPGYERVVRQGRDALRYNISSSYNASKSDNTIILKIVFNDITLNETIDLRFIKEGESGTNGSKFTCIITHDGYAYGEKDKDNNIRKLQIVYINGQGWRRFDSTTGEIVNWEDPVLDVKVYSDGLLLSNGQYNIDWSMFDIDTTDPFLSIDTNGKLSIREKDGQRMIWGHEGTELHSTIVEAKIAATDKDSVDNQETIYAYYPIECTYISTEKMSLVPNFMGGFSSVLYASDGTNPKYDSSTPFTCIPNFKDDENIYYAIYNWSTNDSNLKISGGTNLSTCVIKPKTPFQGGDSLNYVKTQINYTKETLEQLQNDVDKQETTKSEKEEFKKYLEDFKSNVLDINTNFWYNYNGNEEKQIKSYKTQIENSKLFIDRRNTLIIDINNCILQLEKINTYCSERKFDITIFNYIEIYNQLTEQLNDQKGKLYSLGKTDEYGLNSIVDLIKIQFPYQEEFIIRYGRSVYKVLYNLLLEYNRLVQKYNNENDFQDFFRAVFENNYVPFIRNIIAFTNYTNEQGVQPFVWLAQNWNIHSDLIENINFEEFKSTVEALINLFYNSKQESALSYADILDFLEQIKSTINEATNEASVAYINTALEGVREEITSLTNEIANSQKIINEEITAAAARYIIHYKPIVMTYNRYESNFLNGWDGNKLEISKDEGFIVAPQVGAGLKKDGLFTGITMGVVKKNGSETKIGLFGHSNGVESIFLNAKDGSATFGVSGKGRIIIDPSNNIANIYSSNYQTSDNGTCINLTEGKIHFKSATEGMIYSGTHSRKDDKTNGFYISHDGASFGDCIQINATEGGSVLVGKVNGKKHWTINGDADNSYIRFGTRGNNNSVNISTNEITLGSKFYVDDTGELRLGNGAVGDTGNHWKIGEETISTTVGTETISVLKYKNKNDSNSVYISTKEIALGTKFYVDNTGIMRIGTNAVVPKTGADANKNKYWTIDGTSSGAYIRYGTNMTSYSDASGEGEEKNFIYIGTDGIRLGNRFSVSDQGHLYVYKGKIGGWDIESTQLKTDNLILKSEGSISGGSEFAWSIAKDGNASFKKITCDYIFSFSGGDNSFSNTGFSFNQANSSWTSGGFSGGGNATYSSSTPNPFDGECKKHITKLAADEIDVHKLNADNITSGTISTSLLKVSEIVTSGNITAALRDPTQGTINIGKVKTGAIEIYTGTRYEGLLSYLDTYFARKSDLNSYALKSEAGKSGSYDVKDDKVTIPAVG